MVQRILEPEIMDIPEGALAYAQADFSSSNQWFVDTLIEFYEKKLLNVLDIGCGPADIPIRLAKQISATHITALDASEPMLALARKAVLESNLDKQIEIINGRIPQAALTPHSYDTVISNSLIHHLPDPLVFWEEVKRLGKTGSAVFVVDLFRPASMEEASAIVERISLNEHPLLKLDFYNSLLAAFSLEEIKQQLVLTGLDHFTAIISSERHWLAYGIL